MRVVAAVVLFGCSRTQPITSCTDDLHGVYASGDQRWDILDERRSLEAYPLFDDAADPPAGVEIAPRVIDLRRTETALVGEVTRRYMQGALRCDAKATARVTACKGDTLEIVLADPQPPIEFSPCRWGQAASSRREIWRRE